MACTVSVCPCWRPPRVAVGLCPSKRFKLKGNGERFSASKIASSRKGSEKQSACVSVSRGVGPRDVAKRASSRVSQRWRVVPNAVVGSCVASGGLGGFEVRRRTQVARRNNNRESVKRKTRRFFSTSFNRKSRRVERDTTRNAFTDKETPQAQNTTSAGRQTLRTFPSTFGGFVQSVGIGLTVAFGGLVFAISFATLVFDGPDAPAGALAAGASFVLWGGFATALVVAARSGLPAIAEVQDGPSAIFAVMAAAIYATPGIEETQKLPTLEAAIVLTTVCTGLLMTFLGHRKLGNIVRLLPSPVTGGFLAGTGWVLTAGAFKVLSGGLPLSFENLNQFFLLGGDKSYEQLMFVTGPGVLLGLTLAVGNRRIGKFWVVPVCLSGGVLGYFSVLNFLGVSTYEAMARGYLLGPFPDPNQPRRFGFFLDSSLGDGLRSLTGSNGVKVANPEASGLFGTSFDPLLRHPETLFNQVRWDVVYDQAPGAVAVFGLSVLGVLLITSAVELSTERDGDANDELKAVGLANIVSGLGGGFVGYHSLSSTQIAHGMSDEKTTSRVPGVTCAVAYIGALVVGPAPLAYVPSALIGGLLLFIGISFLYEWVVEGRARLPRSEYAVVLLIVVTVASQGYVAGVAAGVLGAAAVFVSDYSKVPVVRSRLRLGQAGGVRSSAPHNRREQNVISKRGAKTFGAKLQGFLFFATSYKVLEQIQEAHQLAMRVSSNESLTYGTGGTGGSADDTDASTVPGSNPGEGRGLSHVVLDFAAVVGVDGSAIAVFEKLRRWARREGVTLVLCDCDRPELERVLDITLSGEAQPTFAFVDRPSARRLKRQSTKTTNKDTSADNATDTTIPLPPNLIGVAEDVGDGLVSCDVTGSIIQTTDLDAALRFVESSLLNLEAQAVSSQRQSELGTCGGSIGDWSANEVSWDDDDGFTSGENDRSLLLKNFTDVCESVCETPDEFAAFRGAWVPVSFSVNQVVCERGEVADRIYWIENAVVVVETGGQVTEDVGDDTGFDIVEDDTGAPENTKDDFQTDASVPAVSSAGAAGGTSVGTAVAGPLDKVTSLGDDVSNGETVSVDDSVDNSDTLPTTAKRATEIATAERASYGVSVTSDFMGAVGFYRRGGVGKVRFGRIVVREPGGGFCLTAVSLVELETNFPKLALRLHKLMAGTLANQVVSRNKLITQFVK